MGIADSVAKWLTSIGHDAMHLNDENLYQLEDGLILAKAINERRIIITADMDFGQLLAFNRSETASVIQFRTSDFTPGNVKAKLQLLFDKFVNQLDEHFIITVEDNRMRFRKLPI